MNQLCPAQKWPFPKMTNIGGTVWKAFPAASSSRRQAEDFNLQNAEFL